MRSYFLSVATISLGLMLSSCETTDTGNTVPQNFYGQSAKVTKHKSTGNLITDMIAKQNATSNGVFLSAKELNNITAAINSPYRPAKDRLNDSVLRPYETLSFLNVKPGMQVLDLNAGDGWYTELLARSVGSNGRVVLHNDEATNSAWRVSGNRLKNVKLNNSDLQDLKVRSNSKDMVTWMMGPHHLYADQPTEKQVRVTFEEIYRVTKPGGTFAIIDNASNAGVSPFKSAELERIDPNMVAQLASRAGFKLDARSDVLSYKKDKGKAVHKTENKGEVDRFVLRFKKPVI